MWPNPEAFEIKEIFFHTEKNGVLSGTLKVVSEHAGLQFDIAACVLFFGAGGEFLTGESGQVLLVIPPWATVETDLVLTFDRLKRTEDIERFAIGTSCGGINCEWIGSGWMSTGP